MKMEYHIKGRNFCDSCKRYVYPKSNYCSFCGQPLKDKRIYFICWFENTRIRQSDKSTANETEPSFSSSSESPYQ